MKEHGAEIAFISLVIIMLFGVLFWNYVSHEQAEAKKKAEKDTETMNSVEANNVAIIDGKLGSDIRITQDYLIKYTRKKSGIWYLSNAKVKNIKEDGSNLVFILSNGENDLIANISGERSNVQVNDDVYFVGTVDLSDGSIDLAKVSTEEINYSSAVKVNFNDLVNNISLLKSNHFLVSGYLVTDHEQYKLFDSKESYGKDASVGTYFTINWKEDFNFTGNQDILVDCIIKDTYKLGECVYIEK